MERLTDGDVFASMNWTLGFDNAARMTSAESALNGWTFDYGDGDERLRIGVEDGPSYDFTTGSDGRIAQRGSIDFEYDASGRRTEDDRFVYTWTWRGELAAVVVKSSWPDADGDGEPEISPFAGHRLTYTYDARSRLLFREHRGELPESLPDGGVPTDADRPFIEMREYVWDGWSLSTEVAYGAPDRTQARWRKTYVPGPRGLDDAVQVWVEVEPSLPMNPYAGQSRLYSYLRDEMGTVVGMVVEQNPPTEGPPPIPLRYLYSPFGEAHAELGPELRRVFFDAETTSAEGAPDQVVADERLAAAGALVMDWSIRLDQSSLDAALTVEQRSGGSWEAFEGVARVALEATASGDDETPPQLVLLPQAGWPRGRRYRVRLEPGLLDRLGRRFAREKELTWRVEAAPEPPAVPPAVEYRHSFPFVFESADAARESVEGRFPGGQGGLFQGLWTDPVTGVSYARNRWYDARTGVFLSEDPMGDVDSPNLYQFGLFSPLNYGDPMGLESRSKYKGIIEKGIKSMREGARYCAANPMELECQGPIARSLINRFGDDAISDRAQVLGTVGPPGKNPVLFVNGILNPPSSAIFYAEETAKWLGRPVTPIWNPTRSGLEDILQTTLVNKLNLPDRTTRKVVETIRDRLSQLGPDESLTLVGHSQGAAISTSSLSHLSEAERARIDFISIGGASCTFPKGLRSLTVFINTRDIVPMGAGAGFHGCNAMTDRYPNAEIHYSSFGEMFDFENTHGVDDYRSRGAATDSTWAPGSEAKRRSSEMGEAIRTKLSPLFSPWFWHGLGR